ncbi:MAG: hypothetical protein Q8T11_18065 [Elusimicrobiota bacterium]|nr:hypothetical protein [Elusimicrobiota bacterium]
MRTARCLIAALLLGGTFVPLGADALAHAWSDVHVHRHADGDAHSHDHDADHHEREHEFGSDAARDARLRPSPSTAGDGEDLVTLLPAAAPAAESPRLDSMLSASRLPGASPGRRALPHLGRAPPA